MIRKRTPAALVAFTLAGSVVAPVPSVSAVTTANKKSHCTPAPPPADSVRWGKPVVVEDFSGKSINEKRWYVYDFKNEIQPRVRAAVKVKNGALEISGGKRYGKDTGGAALLRGHRMYGRWEVRLRADKGAGFTPRALLWPGPKSWPAGGEIDLAEIYKAERHRAVHFLHNGPSDNKCDWLVEKDFTRWHTVAVDWLPKSITFWVDGRRTLTVTDPVYVPSTKPMELVLQLDPGCDQYIACRNASTPKWVRMYVDWVKVYRWPGV
ncbi:glycoside hydrolase family 16 protein [Streptosporangium sp. NPDC048047]|uniref:glycoside hydrolase family 16 protein n=1 Tax=Streptosporangium sp. NPDC048047 TaxID=3155748 RepID=UPI003437C555